MGVTDRRARPAAIAVLGSTTCEDTAAVTSPLRATDRGSQLRPSRLHR